MLFDSQYVPASDSTIARGLAHYETVRDACAQVYSTPEGTVRVESGDVPICLNELPASFERETLRQQLEIGEHGYDLYSFASETEDAFSFQEWRSIEGHELLVVEKQAARTQPIRLYHAAQPEDLLGGCLAVMRERASKLRALLELAAVQRLDLAVHPESVVLVNLQDERLLELSEDAWPRNGVLVTPGFAELSLEREPDGERLRVVYHDCLGAPLTSESIEWSRDHDVPLLLTEDWWIAGTEHLYRTSRITVAPTQASFSMPSIETYRAEHGVDVVDKRFGTEIMYRIDAGELLPSREQVLLNAVAMGTAAMRLPTASVSTTRAPQLAPADEEDAEAALSTPALLRDLGQVRVGSLQSVVFELDNRTDTLVRIEDVVPSCSVEAIESTEKTLEPGARVELRAALRVAEAGPSEFHLDVHHVRVDRDGHDEAVLRLTVTANGVPTVVVDPRAVYVPPANAAQAAEIPPLDVFAYASELSGEPGFTVALDGRTLTAEQYRLDPVDPHGARFRLHLEPSVVGSGLDGFGAMTRELVVHLEGDLALAGRTQLVIGRHPNGPGADQRSYVVAARAGSTERFALPDGWLAESAPQWQSVPANDHVLYRVLTADGRSVLELRGVRGTYAELLPSAGELRLETNRGALHWVIAWVPTGRNELQ